MRKDQKAQKQDFVYIPVHEKPGERFCCPAKIGHAYTPILYYPMEQLSLFKDHRRLTVFFNKGLECANPHCKLEGCYIIVGVDCKGTQHVDIYTKNFTLMTVDHIHPLSKGGGESLKNKQPLCTYCNCNKSNKLDYQFKPKHSKKKARPWQKLLEPLRA